MQKIISLKYKGKVLRVEAKNLGFFGRIRGLMFRTKETDNLLFEFKKPERIRIHSMFVFFSFVGVWLDKNNKILQIKVVKPFQFSVSSEKSKIIDRQRPLFELPSLKVGQ